LVFEAVFFGLGTHVAVGHIDFVGSQSAMGDAGGGDTRDAIGMWELGLDQLGEFFGHESAYFGVGKHHSVVTIDRGKYP